MSEQTEAARREYWTQQMNEAFNFMELMREYPVEECGEEIVSLPSAAAAEGVEVLFSQSKIAFDLERVFYLRAGLIENFIGVARAMNQRNWVLKVEDGFRSVEMQRQLSRNPKVFESILKTTTWECGEVPAPDFLLKRVSALIATRPKVGTHMSGSAIDISVFDRASGEEIDRGGPYLEMSEKTPMRSPFVSDKAQQNRIEITALMEKYGFIAYPFEFWHYNAGDCYAEYLTSSKKPGRYGAVHFDVNTGKVNPVEDAQELLQSPEVSRELITQVLTNC